MLMFLRQTWQDAYCDAVEPGELVRDEVVVCLDPDKVRRRYAIATVPSSWPGFTNRLLPRLR